MAGAESLTFFQGERGAGCQSKVLPRVSLVYRHQHADMHTFLCMSGHRGSMDVDRFL